MYKELPRRTRGHRRFWRARKHAERDGDVAARSLGVRADLFCLRNEVLRDGAVDASNADVEACVRK